MWGPRDADKLPPSAAKLNLPVDSQSGGWRFSERLRRLHQTGAHGSAAFTHLPPASPIMQTAWWMASGRMMANSPQHTITLCESHHKYSTSHRYIRLVLRWQERRAEGSAASVWGVISATQRRRRRRQEEHVGSPRWFQAFLLEDTFQPVRNLQGCGSTRKDSETSRRLRLQVHNPNKTECT